MSWTMTMLFFCTHSAMGIKITLVIKVKRRMEIHQFPVRS